MFDRQQWLNEYRAADKDEWTTIEVDLADDVLEQASKSAAKYDMTLEEYIVWALVCMLDDEKRT